MRAIYYIVYEKDGEHRTEYATSKKHLDEMVAECKRLCYKIVRIQCGVTS